MQLKSKIGGDSYVFNTKKSIAKGFQTFLSCQVPFLATFVPLAWHGMQLKEFKIAIQSSMIGIDAYLFCADKSIASNFK